MRAPLFVWLRFASGHPLVPDELRYSKILSFQYLAGRSNGIGYLSFWQPMDGAQRIDCIVDRILRERGNVRFQEVARIRSAVAKTIYESSTQLSLYHSRHVSGWGSGCFSRRNEDCIGFGQRLYAAGDTRSRYMRTVDVRIVEAPKMPCAWCGMQTFFRESWFSRFGNRKIHCNAPECRRAHHLQHIPQSRGGIDLTPSQRKSTSREAWDTQKAINFLILRVKEIKRGSRKHHDVR